ncbi:MAG: hypothetical protein JWM36_4369 [Hyphomicrobiales bacterium]|nr:hypothetical protein [Hyphomicrobiales bacterium]
MDDARQLPSADYARLKAAFRDLVEASGGVNRAARVTRVNAPRISSCGSAQKPDFAALDVIADLEAECGQPIVSAMLADLAGFVLVPKEATTKPQGIIDHASAELMIKNGHVQIELGHALADGACTAEEAADLLPRVRGLSATVHTLDEALTARATRRA